MQSERIDPQMSAGAGLVMPVGVVESCSPFFTFDVELVRDGEVIWREVFRNLVMTGGKNDLLDKYFKGSGYTATWFLGLVDAAGFTAYNAADTMASHAGWAESTAYSNATRPAPSFGTPASGSLSTSAVSAFSINATATIKGLFVATNNTKGGTTGILYSAGNFATGDRAVLNGDTLNASLTLNT